MDPLEITLIGGGCGLAFGLILFATHKVRMIFARKKLAKKRTSTVNNDKNISQENELVDE